MIKKEQLIQLFFFYLNEISHSDNGANIYIVPRVFDTLCKQEEHNKMKVF